MVVARPVQYSAGRFGPIGPHRSAAKEGSLQVGANSPENDAEAGVRQTSLEAAGGALFRAAPVPAWIFDVETLRFLEVNDAAVARYGWSREEFLRLTLLDIRPAEEHDRLREAVGRVPEGVERSGLWRHCTRSGEVLDVEIHSHALLFDGRAAELVFVHDVSQRVREERTRRDTHERLRALLDAMPGVVLLLDEDGGYIEGSGESELLVASPQQFIGRGIGDFFPPAQTAEFIAVIRRALEAGTTLDYAYTLDLAQSRVHFEARVSPLRSTFGGRRAVVWVAWDVSERHRAMQALHESETRLRTILDSAPECVKVIDGEGRLVSMNRAGLQMLGIPRIEDLTDSLQFVAPHDRDAFRRLHAEVMAGAPAELGFDAQRADGRTLRFHTTAAPLRDATGAIVSVLAITRDVTEQRRLESMAWQSQKLESIGRLAGGIAHDFNNMLTVILGYVELLLMRDAVDDAVRRDVENVRSAALRARDLTAQLLAFGRRQVTRRRPTCPGRVIAGIEPLLRRLLGEDIALEVRSGTDGALVLADPAQLEQILMNLVLNARDAMPEGGRVTIDATWIEILDPTKAPPGVSVGRHVRIRVTDTGHGMDGPTLERVFEPFFTTKRMTSGTGLGLATVYGAVQQNGGAISATSAPGQGTTFEILFPVAENAILATDDVEPAPEAGRGRGETVLVVEDDAEVRGFVRRVLVDGGYAVLEADSVSSGLRVAANANSIELVITDVVMAEGGGLEVLRGVEQHHPRARQLLVSGYAESEAARTRLVDPAVNFLQKPFTPEVLLRRVRELLRPRD